MRTFTFTFNTSAKQKVWKDRKDLDRAGLEDTFSTVREDERKDGFCFIPGGLIGTERKANAVEFIDALVYDVDGWQTLEELDKIVDATGVYAVIYSSHSHLSTKTVILVDHYIRWAKRQGRPEREPTEEELLDYLRDPGTRKSHLKDAKCDLKIIQTAEGQAYTIEHAPVPKFRVVFPLKTRMKIADLAVGSTRAILAYKSIYHGVGQALGLDYDRACEDPSRLYYTPSHKPGADYVVWQFNWDQDNPVLLDWEAYPRAAVADKSRRISADGSTKKINSGDRTVLDKNNFPIDLAVWESKNYDFDIEALLEQVLDDDMIKARRDRGGFHITCPFEHEHSTTGGMGTFCANGDGDYSWKIYCMHDACNGRSRTDYVEELIKQGYITAQDLGINGATPPEEKPPVTPTPVEAKKEEHLAKAAEGLGLQLHTLAPDLFDDEPSAALEDFEDKPLEGDDALSAEEVYVECLTALEAAENEADIRATFGRMRHKRCSVDLEEITEMMSKSKASGNTCVRLLRGFITQLGEDPTEFVGHFSLFRERTKSLADWIKETYDKALTGPALNLEFARMAAFYAYHIRVIRDRFNAHQEALIREAVGATVARYFPEMRQRYAKLHSGNNVVFLDIEKTLMKRAPSIMTKAALSTLLENRNEVQYTDKGKEIRFYVFDEWVMRDRSIKEYSELTYIPRGAPIRVPAGAFNMWDDSINHGFFIPPMEGDCSLITDHIRDVWCSGDKDLYNWVITWLAQIIQRPGDKPPSALVLLGPPGTGKSVIFEHGISRILGPMYWKSANREDIVGKFNAHSAGKLLTLAEEVLFAGDKRGMQLLKDRISSTSIDIEPKGVDKFQIPSYTRYVFTSNNEHALHLENNDRRFCVLNTDVTHMQDTEYFSGMVKFLESGGVNYFFNFLLKWVPEEHGLTWRSLNQVPGTAGRVEQIYQTYEAADMFFYEMLTDGCPTSVPRDVFTDKVYFWPYDLSGSDPNAFRVDAARFKRLFHEFVRYHAPKNHEYQAKRYRECFKNFIGCTPAEIEKVLSTKNLDGTYKKFRALCLPERVQCLEDANKKRLLLHEHYRRANTDKLNQDATDNSEVT